MTRPVIGTVSLSIVTMIYKSRGFLESFLQESVDAAREVAGEDFEIVCVIDGSPDDSMAYLLSRKADIPQLVIVELSRNFGHHPACLCGLATARGERVYLTDCDLEVRPAELLRFAREQARLGCDVVFGVQEKRIGGATPRIAGGLFWRIFNKLSDVKVAPDPVTERLMSRRYVDALITLGDKNLFLAGMMAWVGFSQQALPVRKQRRDGQSTYSLARRIGLFVQAITSFSAAPLIWTFWMGMGIAALTGAYGIYLSAARLIFPDSIVSGFTFMAVLLLFSTGLIVMSIGMIGIYIARIYTTVQSRPVYLIKQII